VLVSTFFPPRAKFKLKLHPETLIIEMWPVDYLHGPGFG